MCHLIFVIHRLYDVRQKSMCDEWKLVSNSAAGSNIQRFIMARVPCLVEQVLSVVVAFEIISCRV